MVMEEAFRSMQLTTFCKRQLLRRCLRKVWDQRIVEKMVNPMCFSFIPDYKTCLDPCLDIWEDSQNIVVLKNHQFFQLSMTLILCALIQYKYWIELSTYTKCLFEFSLAVVRKSCLWIFANELRRCAN